MSAFGTLMTLPDKPVERALIVGLYDFTLYTKWAEQQSASETFQRLDAYFEFTGGFINDTGGLFVKAIGDAGLFIFPGETSLQMKAALDALTILQSSANKWLQQRNMDSRVVVQMNYGNIACGQIGAPENKRFDVYGNAVNQVFLLKANRFAITTAFYNHCLEETQSRFEKTNPQSWELKA